MSKKITIFLGALVFVFVFVSSFFYFYYFLPPQFLYPIKQKISTGGWSTSVNTKYGVVIKYLNSSKAQKVSDSSVAIFTGGDTKPYIIDFKKVPEQSFQEWSRNQDWFGVEKDYTFVTSSSGQPMILRDTTQTLSVIIRPGILVTIENAISSQQHYQSQKILLDIADNLKPLFGN